MDAGRQARPSDDGNARRATITADRTAVPRGHRSGAIYTVVLPALILGSIDYSRVFHIAFSMLFITEIRVFAESESF